MVTIDQWCIDDNKNYCTRRMDSNRSYLQLDTYDNMLKDISFLFRNETYSNNIFDTLGIVVDGDFEIETLLVSSFIRNMFLGF